MANGNDAIMRELKEIKEDGKSTLEKTTENSIAIARVEGSIALQGAQILRNRDDISENRGEIGKVRDSVKNMLVKAAGFGGAIGAIAGFLASKMG